MGEPGNQWGVGRSMTAGPLDDLSPFAVGLFGVLQNPAIDALGLSAVLSPELVAERTALHELTKEAMGVTGKELTRADAEILTEWAREYGTKGRIDPPHEPPIDFPHAHIDKFNHVPIKD